MIIPTTFIANLLKKETMAKPGFNSEFSPSSPEYVKIRPGKIEISPSQMESIYREFMPAFSDMKIETRKFFERMFEKGCGPIMKEALTESQPLCTLLFTYEEVSATMNDTPPPKINRKRKALPREDGWNRCLFKETDSEDSRSPFTPPEKRPNFLRGKDGKKLIMPKKEKIEGEEINNDSDLEMY